MLGPLPTLYRVIVSVCALAAFIGLGVWVTETLSWLSLPLAGVGTGAALGLAVVALLLHDSGGPHGPHRVGVRTHRPD